MSFIIAIFVFSARQELTFVYVIQTYIALYRRSSLDNMVLLFLFTPNGYHTPHCRLPEVFWRGEYFPPAFHITDKNSKWIYPTASLKKKYLPFFCFYLRGSQE